MKVSTEVLNQGCAAFGVDPKSAVERQGMEAALYEIGKGDSRYLLRLSPVAAKDRDRHKARWKFVDFLAQLGGIGGRSNQIYRGSVYGLD